jgi:hypothetical protein
MHQESACSTLPRSGGTSEKTPLRRSNTSMSFAKGRHEGCSHLKRNGEFSTQHPSIFASRCYHLSLLYEYSPPPSFLLLAPEALCYRRPTLECAMARAYERAPLLQMCRVRMCQVQPALARKHRPNLADHSVGVPYFDKGKGVSHRFRFVRVHPQEQRAARPQHQSHILDVAEIGSLAPRLNTNSDQYISVALGDGERLKYPGASACVD